VTRYSGVMIKGLRHGGKAERSGKELRVKKLVAA
jgi:hypothetical protein